jgi:UDP-N-acetylglucosamine 2-epimerase (non-hydrolysing)
MQHLPLAEKKSNITDHIRFKRFALATAHRAENVDDPATLRSIIESFAEAPIPVVYPMHPRTRKRLRQSKTYAQLAKSQNVQILPPVGYLDFLVLMKKCEMIITDSGGIQEEATAPTIRKPVLVIRLSTERQESVEAGFSRVVGVQRQGILEAMEDALNRSIKLPNKTPYGDGSAGERIVGILEKELSL